MKNILFFTLAFSLQAPSLLAATSWENPAVMCPEEILARGFTCPDFTQVQDVYTDYPDAMTKAEILDWKNNKASDLKLCRNQEVLRREAIKPGSYSKMTIELAWMTVDGGKQVREKLMAIEAASKKYEIPPQILIGAMKQESLLSSLGVSPDGGNYSCGISQLNIQEWCQGMNSLSDTEKNLYGWPTDISCDSDVLPTKIVEPFYNIAVTKLGTRQPYQMTSEDFKGITSEQVLGGFPEGNSNLQSKRFLAASSFVNNCQNLSLAINFKAFALRSLYINFVPQKLKDAENYLPGQTFSRTCESAYTSKYFPLHTGWLLAVAMYNAGPLQAKLVGFYYQAKSSELPEMNPLDLIEALHWGGKYKTGTDNIVFSDMDAGKPRRHWFKKNENILTQSWFKSCIVQRHVAKVIQYATLPAESIAKSLEQAPCTPTGVPDYRKNSSGIKE